MASWNFRRGLVLLNMKRQFDTSSTKALSTSLRVFGGHGHSKPAHGGEAQHQPIKLDIGKREIVGFGCNGEEIYYDHVHYPFPAIRFKEDTPEIMKLREKEKGDWKKMTVDDKKALYRASFAQTISEFTAPSGDNGRIVGLALTGIAMGLWMFFGLVRFIYDDLPATVTDEEHLKAQMQRMIDMEANPVQGYASQWDYEKRQWKVKW